MIEHREALEGHNEASISLCGGLMASDLLSWFEDIKCVSKLPLHPLWFFNRVAIHQLLMISPLRLSSSFKSLFHLVGMLSQ